MIAPIVTFSWEINPLRVSELIAHEGEVALVAQTERNESDHFVQSHASEYPWCLFVEYTHMSVDFSIKQPH